MRIVKLTKETTKNILERHEKSPTQSMKAGYRCHSEYQRKWR